MRRAFTVRDRRALVECPTCHHKTFEPPEEVAMADGDAVPLDYFTSAAVEARTGVRVPEGLDARIWAREREQFRLRGRRHSDAVGG